MHLLNIGLNDVLAEVHREHPEFSHADIERVEVAIQNSPRLTMWLRNTMLGPGAGLVAGWMHLSPHDAAFSRFVVLTHRTLQGEPITMATQIVDDAISNIPIVFDNLGGVAVAKPAGSTDTVSVDNTAAFSVAMGADGTSVDVTPVQPPTDGAVGVITYQNSMISQPSVLNVVIGADTAAVSDHFDDTHITTRPLGT